ncbi:hypothetical protein KAW50_03955 [candidate division WOR-3 bacterium]|nr:hypothetical protein [candidate division WOR-3 bacterium]
MNTDSHRLKERQEKYRCKALKRRRLWRTIILSVAIPVILTIIGIIFSRRAREITEKREEIHNVTSYNQSGGITADKVIIHPENPKPLLKDKLKEILNSINPEIIPRFLRGSQIICVCISQFRLNKLLEIKEELIGNKLLDFQSIHTTIMKGNTINDCINDIDGDVLSCYRLKKLERFDITYK